MITTTVKALFIFVIISLSFSSCEKSDPDYLGDERILGDWNKQGNSKYSFTSEKLFYEYNVCGETRIRSFYTEYDSLFILNDGKPPWKSKYSIEKDTLTLVYLNGAIEMTLTR